MIKKFKDTTYQIIFIAEGFEADFGSVGKWKLIMFLPYVLRLKATIWNILTKRIWRQVELITIDSKAIKIAYTELV